MKKVLVCALAALFLMATCLTAFAEPVTTTAYVDDKLVVTTTVTDATNGDMLTYLAYEGDAAAAPASDDDIVYIDQQTFVEGKTTTFSYTTDKDAWVGTVVKSGSSAADVETYVTTLEGRNITVTVNDGDTVTTKNYTLPSQNAGTYVTDIAVANVEIDTVTVNDAVASEVADVQNGKIVIVDNGLADDAVIVITMKVPDTFDPAVSLGKGKSFVTKDAEDKDVEKLTVFGEVKTDVAEASGNWGGILITKVADSATEDNFKIGAANVTDYAAKARAGEANVYTFAVQLVNYGALELTTAPLWARVYSVDANGDYAYGAPIAFNEVVAD
ncbi:MAG: hypothetical protein IJN62_05165 [Clostridia bacterium]|nr:hypothetical protein [Clostridia bacterium]